MRVSFALALAITALLALGQPAPAQAQPFRHPFVSAERLEAIEKAVRARVASMTNLQKAKNLDMVSVVNELLFFDEV